MFQRQQTTKPTNTRNKAARLKPRRKKNGRRQEDPRQEDEVLSTFVLPSRNAAPCAKTVVFSFWCVLCISWFVFLICSRSAQAQVPLAVPVDGQPFEARLTSVDAQGKLGFDMRGKLLALASADLVSWGQPAELRKGPIVVLADGGYLPAAVLSSDKTDLSVDSARLGALKLPLDSLAGVVFRPPP